jgi:two-component sensor histidine kinase
MRQTRAVPKLTELARDMTTLDREQIAHLNRVVSEWGMLADLSFADLLLCTPNRAGAWTVVAQVRPATAQTIFPDDLVGTRCPDDKATVLAEALATKRIVAAEPPAGGAPGDAPRLTAIPVVCAGVAVAVLTKEWAEQSGRRPGQLEHTYGRIFEQFARMIAAGSFPFAERVGDSSSAPRVGDGVMWLGRAVEVRYMSPNASSALHRVGIQSSALGMRLAELGFHDGVVRQAFEHQVPVIEEFEQADVTLLCRCVPLLEGAEVDGAILLMRDVTELRKRDRLLLSKDATIREIHHRVKNNLQTISSLLRLQARRLKHPEAIAAVGESVRRIRTIALVHEALSREVGDDVTFAEIVRPLVRLAEEGLQSPDRPIRFTVRGDGGRIPAAIATPLSVVLTELLQNAVDHGFPEGSSGGSVRVDLRNLGNRLDLAVADDGRGVDAGFRLEEATGLGLSIVRTLVTTELNGTITMRPNQPRGTQVELSVPLAEE